LKIVLLAVAVPIAAALAFSFFAAQLPAADSVSHFRLHLAVLLIAISGLLLITKTCRAASVFFVLAISSCATMSALFAGKMPLPAHNDTSTLQLLQLNTYFKNTSIGSVVKLIKRHDPDVITLQEISKQTMQIVDVLSERYPSKIICPFSGVGAVAVLLRVPKFSVEDKGCIKNQGFAWIRANTNGRPITFASLHLHWPYPFKQHQQISRLEKHLKSLRPPTIIAGDFNAAPWSHAATRISTASRTIIVSGLRFTLRKPLATWAPQLKLPIDHVLASRELTPLGAELGSSVGSDHMPVLARFALPLSQGR
jgi:endonuclease/exonuclease/phosphatase (EEP) superfamily protein YafD